MRHGNFLFKAAALTFAAMLLTGCGDNSSTNQANNGEIVLRRGNMAEPKSLDPAVAASNWEDNIISDMMIGLMTYDTKADAIPGIATSWETSPDGLTWTFHLRDAKWSDGQPVTADDFIYAWRRILEPVRGATYAYFLYDFKNAKAINAGKLPGTALGARAIDDKTLEVTLEHPVPYFLQMLTHMPTYPVPKHVVEIKGNDWVKPGNYVSDGPYVLVDWIPQDRVEVKKNPEFYDAENVKIDRVIYYNTDDYEAALRRFRAGEIDTQDRQPPGQIDWIKQNMPEVMLTPEPQFTMDYIVTNFTHKPFDDVRVREALNLAFDRDIITEKLRRVREISAYNLVPPHMANYPGAAAPSFKDLPMADRIKQAQALMQGAGYGPNKRLSANFLIRSAQDVTYMRAAAAAQQMWRDIYVDIEIVPLDAALFYDRVRAHDFDIAEAAWGADYNDATTFLDLMRTGNDNNYGEYSNTAFDALLDRAQKELDLEKRGQLLVRAENIALKDQVWFPAYYWVEQNLVRPYVKGWEVNPVDFHRTRWMSIDTKARSAMFGN